MNPTGPDQITPDLQPLTPQRRAEPGAVERDRDVNRGDTGGDRNRDQDRPSSTDNTDFSLEGDEADKRPESTHAGYTDSQAGGMIVDDGCLLEPSGD